MTSSSNPHGPDSSSSGVQGKHLAGRLPLRELLSTLSSPWKPALAVLELQERLGVLLRLVLRDRVLWTQSPDLLGDDFSTWPHWQEPEALEALVQACYEFVVIHRFQMLRLLSDGDDALANRQLLRQVHDFMGERQRHADPVGHAVWCNTQVAVAQVVEQGFVHLRGRRQPLGGNTWLLFSHEDGQYPVWEQLHGEPGWQQLQRSLGRVRSSVQERLAIHLARLAGRRVQPCQFRDLVAVLQENCRACSVHPALDGRGVQQLQAVVDFIRPDMGFGDWDGWRFWMSRLEDDVDVQLENVPARKRCQRLLAALLWYVEADQIPPAPARLGRELDVQLDELLEDLELLVRITAARDPT